MMNQLMGFSPQHQCRVHEYKQGEGGPKFLNFSPCLFHLYICTIKIFSNHLVFRLLNQSSFVLIFSCILRIMCQLPISFCLEAYPCVLCALSFLSQNLNIWDASLRKIYSQCKYICLICKYSSYPKLMVCKGLKEKQKQFKIPSI